MTEHIYMIRYICEMGYNRGRYLHVKNLNIAKYTLEEYDNLAVLSDVFSNAITDYNVPLIRYLVKIMKYQFVCNTYEAEYDNPNLNTFRYLSEILEIPYSILKYYTCNLCRIRDKKTILYLTSTLNIINLNIVDSQI